MPATPPARSHTEIRADAEKLTAMHADGKLTSLSWALGAQAGYDLLALLDRIDALTSAVYDPSAPVELHIGDCRVQLCRNNERYCVWTRHGIAHPGHEWHYAYTRPEELGGITSGSYSCDGLIETEAGRPFPLPPVAIESGPEDLLTAHTRHAPDCAYRIRGASYYGSWCRQCRYDSDQGVYGQSIAQPRPEAGR